MKEGKNIDKLIREHLKEEIPSNDFTDQLIQKISDAELKEEIVLKHLAKKYLPEEPSKDFTQKVMTKISENSEVFTYQPLISKKVWTLIASGLAVFIVGVLFFSFTTDQKVVVSNCYFVKFIKVISADSPKFLRSPLFALSMFAMSSLFFLDYYFRDRKYS